MADAQVGNVHGLAAVGERNKLAEITADGANTVTIAPTELQKISAGMVIDILNKTTFAVLAIDRNVTNVTSGGVVTYDGADVAAVAGTHAVFQANSDVPAARSNLNGGAEDNSGFDNDNLDTIKRMRARLAIIDSGFYTAARLNAMTVNDMIFAIRTSDNPASIKQ